MDITIKKMETADEIRGKAFVHWRSWHEAYPGLVSQDYLDNFTLERAEKMAASWMDGILVAKDGERVIGFVGYGVRDEAPDTGEIFALYVLSEYYGTGVGKSLFEAALEQLKGYEQVCLWVLKDNPRAIRFYQKCGFVATGEEMISPRIEAAEIKMVSSSGKDTKVEVKLVPVDDTNKEAVLALSVREDQPFVAPNDVSLIQADELNAEYPGVARPFAIYADEKLVGFCHIIYAPEAEDEDDRYYLWRFMIDQTEQNKGFGQAAIAEIIRYFRERDANVLYLSTEPENEVGLHVYHKFGFKETGEIDDGEAILKLML